MKDIITEAKVRVRATPKGLTITSISTSEMVKAVIEGQDKFETGEWLKTLEENRFIDMLKIAEEMDRKGIMMADESHAAMLGVTSAILCLEYKKKEVEIDFPGLEIMAKRFITMIQYENLRRTDMAKMSGGGKITDDTFMAEMTNFGKSVRRHRASGRHGDFRWN